LEAVETIMGVIEGGDATQDDRPAFIFAGYEEDMKRFVNANNGMRRRITDTFVFENYSMDDLFDICASMARKAGFQFEVEKNVSLDVMRKCFSVQSCINYNAGISLELFSACKCQVNARVMCEIGNFCTSKDSKIWRVKLMQITDVDFDAACTKVGNKMKDQM
jgi:hypothetical protein